MNFLFVDRILELNPGKQSVGLKYVTANDMYLTDAPQPKLFPCIIGEALGQLCSWNVLKTTDFRFRPVGGVVQEIEMFSDTVVGDTIHLVSDIETLDPENQIVRFSGHALVKDKIVFTIKHSLAPLLPLEEFNYLEQVQNDFLDLTHNSKKASDNRKKFPVNYDKVSWEKNQEIVGEKYIDPTAPFFVDHFPKKPVLPLSLLLEYNLHLAHSFISEEMNAKNLRPISVKRVKINNFVLPGDTLITKITCKEQSEKNIVVSFRNEVNNKRICIAEATFG